MKPILKTLLLLFVAVFALQSCEDQDDVRVSSDLQVNDFIWKGLNQFYLYQADIPNLADDRFANQDALNSFLSGYDEPKTLFDALLYKSQDRFSWIVDDYTVLEQELQGTSKSNGVDFRLARISSGSDNLVGFVRYIIPNSDASTKDIKRGELFTGINGTQLTISNYQALIAADTYTLNFATLSGSTIQSNGKTLSLTKTTLDENPILINKVITSGSHKIGYLMYNGFYANYDTQLNAAFGELKAQGITDLILDLRYNGGGSVLTATRLASMITGQFTDKIFAKEKWNAKINTYFESDDPESLNNRFVDKIDGTAINSLNLTKVYVITTDATASASELVINGLVPYISVVQVGETTVGKNVGSITLYDSPTFGKANRNPNHKYAMQPLVLKIINASGFGEYANGLTPTYAQNEQVETMGVLGDPSEPLLSTTISKITGSGKKAIENKSKQFSAVADSKILSGIRNQMYIDEAPEGLLRSLK
ncbi:S41 family peptidase [Flavobacterium sp. Fl-77]|uniref:S41 family peptidase n=1 Tax=Flavobacterium flavipigmentatum TaxID=2893884 RepID=A0AAJ2S824_9FLAO|nr:MULTISPECIES: S41 family peptidase [unclassified Flavobacterium]MDX6182486.1 S41 family peptidase [Flavobacterium sp. Fl-33]MDX6185601.1 S41 family peptidase [Flavobacterium sp. Fl-77]UFH38787.1 peptidase S41 [Flavobacterium sp. F-70]